ncbi:MAG TPA: recombinase family protein [Tepidisphaeraceae bacterium]|nr:recombinase family protein [Tepidisphaeraceae bacterium]
MQAPRRSGDVEAAAIRVTAGYVRLTRDESLKGLSAAAQRENITAYVDRAGLGPVSIYQEAKAVGGDVPFEKRDAGQRLMEDVRRGLVGAIVVRDLDRLTRDVPLWLQLDALCTQHGVAIHTLSGILASKSPSDRFATTVRAAAAQLEKETVGDRVRRVKRAMAQSGRPVGGPPPFGYTSQARVAAHLRAGGMATDAARAESERRLPNKGQLYIDDAEAAVVRDVFDLYVTRRWGSRRISHYLNSRGRRRRSGLLWHADKLRRIINDPVVAGFIPFDEARFESGRGKRTSRHDQVLHKGKHEALVPEDLWRLAQQIKRSNTPKPRDSGRPSCGNRKYALSGLLVCPSCRSPMRAKSSRRGKSFGYYLCTRRKYHGDEIGAGGCPFPQLNSSKVHAAFWAKLSELLASPNLVARARDAANEMMRHAAANQAEQDALGKEAGDLRRQLETWSRRHTDADSDSPEEVDAAAHIRRLKAELKRLRAQASAQPAAPASIPVITTEKVSAYLNSLGTLVSKTGDEGKALVQSLIEHHGLQVSMKDPQTLRLSLRLKPPGADAEAAGEFTVPLQGDARLPKDKITAWVEAQQNTKLCACGCGNSVDVRRRHFWMGVPEFRSTCRHKGMSRRRWQLAKNLYSGQKVARLFGIGRTTVNRWIKSGKLPQPTRSISNMLLFEPAEIDALLGRRTTTR